MQDNNNNNNNNSKENLQSINSKINELEKQKNKLKNEINRKTKYDYRKERTRRLVQTGALAEKYFDIENLSLVQREELFKIFSQFIKSNKPKHLQ